MRTPSGTARDLRRRNRSAVLFRLLSDGPRSRAELSRQTGLSLATVGNVTGELIADRLVVEVGQVDSAGGRPRVLLGINPGYAHLAGVDVGETRVRVELFDLALNRLAEVEYPLEFPRPAAESVAEQMATGLRTVTELAGADPATLLGAGIGVPGTVEPGSRGLLHAQVLNWAGVPLKELLRGAGVSAPLYLDNGAKTQAQAELWYGAGRGVRHAVVVLIGSGVGAAVITDGHTYQGATGSAGEWGHTTIVYGGRECRCGARGCLEAYVGARNILERYRLAGGRPPAPGQDQPTALTELLARADTEEPAGRVLAETAGYLGAGIADLINLFNPERVIVGGWAGGQLGPALLPRIRAAAADYALAHPFRQTSIELGQLGPDAVAIGAATLPLAALLAVGGDPRGDHRQARRRSGAEAHRADAA